MKNSKDISECITDLEFENYIKNNLSDSEINKVEQHCSFCEMCNDSLEGLLALEQNNLFESQKEKLVLKEGGKRINLWVYFSAAAAILIVLGISFLFINKSDENQISSNQLKLSQPIIEKEDAETNVIAKKNEIEDITKNLENVQLKTLNKNEEIIENDVNKNTNSDELAMAKTKQPQAEKFIASEPIKRMAKENITSKAVTEDVAASDYSEKNEIVLDDAEKANVEKKSSTDILTNGNTMPINSNLFSNSNASGSTSVTQNFSTPAIIPTAPIDITNITLNEIATKAKKGTKQDSKINERAGEELKINAAKKFMEQKNYSKAIGQLDRIIRDKSGSVFYEHALWLKAICLKNLNSLPEAKKILDDIIKRNLSYSKVAKDSLKVWSK